jgi:hypothetical protein
VVSPVPQKPQPVDELAHHFFVGLTEEQVQRQHVVHHHVRRQQSRPFLAFPGFADHIIDDVPMDHTAQHPESHMIGQSTGFSLDGSRVLRHAITITRRRAFTVVSDADTPGHL